jgi:hypothetical protein
VIGSVVTGPPQKESVNKQVHMLNLVSITGAAWVEPVGLGIARHGQQNLAYPESNPNDELWKKRHLLAKACTKSI